MDCVTQLGQAIRSIEPG